MNSNSIYKKYIFYLIHPQRNTRKYIPHNNIYIPSPLSKCENADDIRLLYLFESSSESSESSDSSKSSYDKISMQNFMIYDDDKNENYDEYYDIFTFDKNFFED